MKQPSRSTRVTSFEIPIVILIAILMIVLMNFANNKLSELIISDAEALFMSSDHNPDDQMHTDLAESMSEFRPDICKMIEIYNDELEMLIRVQFDDEIDEIDGNYYDNDISQYKTLMNLITHNADGHTSIDIDDMTEYIYFKWSESDDGERFLFIIYTYKPIVRNLWVFHLICYTILVLICFLLLRLSLKSHSEKIRLYNEMTSIKA